MEDIILGGVSVQLLKAQREAMKRDAVKFISDGIQKATENLEEILQDEHERPADADLIAKETADLLENIQLVSSVTGVKYCLPWDHEYDSPYSGQLECNLDWDQYPELQGLFDILESMEGECKEWYNSNCY